MSTTNNDIISPETLSKAGDLEIFDENEKKIKFSTLFATKQTLVIFIRHFLCGNCMEYVCRLSSQITPAELSSKDIHIAIIGCGDPSLIAAYRAETQSKYPIFSDPTQALFKQFGLIRTLALGNKRPQYMSFGVMGGIAKGVGLALKAGRGAFKSGDMKQVGGEYGPVNGRGLMGRFLVGPGGRCGWGHRMTNTRDHVEIEELRRVLKLDEKQEGVGEVEGDGKGIAEVNEMSKQEVSNDIDTPAAA